MKMKKVLSIALSIVMLVGMTTSGFAATAPKSTTVKKVTAPVAPVFKILGDYEFGSSNNEITDKYIQLSFYEDKTIRLVQGLNGMIDIVYTKAVPGKVVVKGTTVWDFTSTVEFYSEGDLPSKKVKGVVSITFKDNKNILSVKMPKVDGLQIDLKQPVKLVEMPVDNGRDGYYGDENYQVGVDDADKSIMLVVPKENKRYEMVYTKATAGKVVIKGTTVWVFTGACKLTTLTDDSETVSKPWNTTITVTYKNRDTVVGVDLAKTPTQPGVSFKGEINNDGGGY
jgi:hypothetical protein